MSERQSLNHIPSRTIILLTSVVLGAAAVVMTFAPAELAAGLGATDGRQLTLLLQLYGAALFGLAMTGWMVKDSMIGGIFGRSYVVGNASHGVIGAFALARPALAGGAPAALRVLAATYCLLAVVFSYLMFASSPRT